MTPSRGPVSNAELGRRLDEVIRGVESLEATLNMFVQLAIDRRLDGLEKRMDEQDGRWSWFFRSIFIVVFLGAVAALVTQGAGR